MDAIVTARVPVEVKEQGGQILRSIGASQTDLINSAYRVLLATKRLPSLEATGQKPKKGHRSLSKDQKAKLTRSLAVMNLGPLPPESFTEQLATARDERYAHPS